MSMPEIKGSCKPICIEEAITNVVQSIALQETGLSHILNAEGEKIQAVVANPKATTQNLLDVNESVEKLVKTVTGLEVVLNDKLKNIQVFFNNANCDFCCKKKPKDCKQY